MFGVVGESHGNDACPDFGEGIGHCNRSVVAKLSSGTFFVEEAGVAVRPTGGGIMVVPQADEEEVEELVELVGCPFECLVGDAIRPGGFSPGEVSYDRTEGDGIFNVGSDVDITGMFVGFKEGVAVTFRGVRFPWWWAGG